MCILRTACSTMLGALKVSFRFQTRLRKGRFVDLLPKKLAVYILCSANFSKNLSYFLPHPILQSSLCRPPKWPCKVHENHICCGTLTPTNWNLARTVIQLQSGQNFSAGVGLPTSLMEDGSFKPYKSICPCSLSIACEPP